MKSTRQDLMVTICGAVTSLLTSLLVVWLEQTFGLSIYGFTPPLGALLCGGVAASGYYAGYRFFNHKPKPIMLLNMVAISLGTYFLIQYLSYSKAMVEGERVSDLISFGRYWDIVTTNQVVQLNMRGRKVGDAVELGQWGYLYSLLQVGGFALGGWAVYRILSSQIYCDKCSLYLSSNGSAKRYTHNPEALMYFLLKVSQLFDEGKYAEAIVLHASEGWGSVGKDTDLMTEVNLKYCKKCGINHFGMEVKKRDGKGNWNAVDNMSFAAFTDARLALVQKNS